MKKTLYSLMLNEEVVREIDLLAHRMGTNRSNMVNQILADYVSVTTPERRVNDIFRAVEAMLSPSPELVPFFEPNAMTMSLKSSLEYKYRPTVKYEVELYRAQDGAMGELSVIFRTQSSSLIAAMTEFFRLWKRIEDAHLAPYTAGSPIEYALYEGRFTRSISMPRGRDYTSEDIAAALSDYIRLFDTLMKGFLSGKYSVRDVESRYVMHLSETNILI